MRLSQQLLFTLALASIVHLRMLRAFKEHGIFPSAVLHRNLGSSEPASREAAATREMPPTHHPSPYIVNERLSISSRFPQAAIDWAMSCVERISRGGKGRWDVFVPGADLQRSAGRRSIVAKL